jgi:NADH-quinone oxidoreductase subunit E
VLHLVQSVDGYVSENGIEFVSDLLGLPVAEITSVASFYTMFKRTPQGKYVLGVCSTALCAIMGGDAIFEALSEYLDLKDGETSQDGMFTLEKIECNAACDYAPVMMVNWEFMDNQTPESAKAIVDQIKCGKGVTSTRGADKISEIKDISLLLAGFLSDKKTHGESKRPEIIDNRPAAALKKDEGGSNGSSKGGKR